MVDGGRVIIRSKPFIASELGGCGDPPRGLKITRARGRSNELRGFNPRQPPDNSSTAPTPTESHLQGVPKNLAPFFCTH